MTMPDRDHLHRLLQAALEVEMFTIPPYLTALYSIIEGSNAAAVQVIHSVVMEEMLHAALVSNLINAVGASPRLIAVAGGAGPQRIGYPAQAPHISRPLIVELAPFSKAAVQGFMAIERPESPTDGAGSEDGAGDENEGGDDSGATIGSLYVHIRNTLIALHEQIGPAALFNGAPARQFGADEYYGAGGRLAPVDNLDSALAAVDVIAQQGEGRCGLTNQAGNDTRFGQPKEVAHFYRFEEIAMGRRYDRDDDVGQPTGARLVVDWDAVLPIGTPSNPQMPAGFQPVFDAFEARYAALLDALQNAFNGRATLADAVPMMHRLKVAAIEIMRIEVGEGKTCVPPFWFPQS